jgi:predicted TIM-barrel fold metal-dependent hydrolase
MLRINRRKFVVNTAASTAGIILGSRLMGFASKEESGIQSIENKKENLMQDVMKYRKIDSHAHVFFNLKNSPEAEVDFAERLGIDRLMVSKFLPSYSKATPEVFRENNDIAIKCMKQHPDRLIATMVFNAAYQKESLEEIDRCVDAGMVGAGELYTQVKINDPLYYPIIEKFIDLKMVMMQHSIVGYSRVKRYASEPVSGSLPEDFVAIAKRYPEAMFQYAHIGGGIDWEYACKTLKDSPNVYVDVSGSNNAANMIDFAMKYIGEDRLLFGCDGSFYQGVGHLFSAKLTDVQRRKIFFENYNNILKKSGNNVN